MNETDVREIVVRPLLTQLGYEQGAAEARVRTEVTLRYANAYLGRKNPNRDPPLAGRADYVCEVVSVGRWVVEAKPPSQALTLDDAEQAHTYAAHPEIGALYFMLTNGREFRIYLVGRLERPIMEFAHSDLASVDMQLRNLLSPQAIRRKVAAHVPDLRKPLGEGLPPIVEVVGGIVRYEKNTADHPMFNNGAGDGLRSTITGGRIDRDDQGAIRAIVRTESGTSWLHALNELSGLSHYEFSTRDEFISTDIARPTVLQSFITAFTAAGTKVNVPMLGEFTLPFDMHMRAVTQATGYYADERFTGLLDIDYDVLIRRDPRFSLRGMPVPDKVRMNSIGDFELNVRLT